MVIPYHRPYNFEEPIITNGEYCRKVESQIERMYKIPAMVCSSGTMALMLAFEAAKYKLGSAMPQKWNLPAFTWFSDPWVLDRCNLQPRLVDIDLDDWCMVDHVCHAKFPTHVFGNIKEYRNSFYIIHDYTHCLGARIDDFGLAGVFSLSATKLVTACEGGILLAEDPVIYNHACYLRDKFARMSEVHAKFALEGLKMLPKFRAWKKKVFWYYKSHIEGEVQWQEKLLDHTYNTIGFVSEKIDVPWREIQYKQYYEPLVKHIYPNTEYIYKYIKCLPSYYGVDYKKIVELINEYNSGNRKQLEEYDSRTINDAAVSGYWNQTY